MFSILIFEKKIKKTVKRKILYRSFKEPTKKNENNCEVEMIK